MQQRNGKLTALSAVCRFSASIFSRSSLRDSFHSSLLHSLSPHTERFLPRAQRFE